MNRYLFLIAILALSACDKKPVPTETPTQKNMTINISHVVDEQELLLNDRWYTINGDSIRFTSYAYFISNIKFYNAQGDTFAEPESYHLINQDSAPSKTFTVSGIPYGSYTGVSFLIGVDSIRNVSGAQTGALDPMSGMFWDWNTGYIMSKLEAEYIYKDRINPLVWHVGGFSGIHNPLRILHVNLPRTITLSDNSAPQLYLEGNIAEWFKTPTLVRLDDNTNIIARTTLVDNYVDMFTVKDIK